MIGVALKLLENDMEVLDYGIDFSACYQRTYLFRHYRHNHIITNAMAILGLRD